MSTSIVVDLGFGDAGKGTLVDALARRTDSAPLIVRHNGGAQAGHNVVTPDGTQHVFSQFGAATFVPGARTLLSKHFIFHPPGFFREFLHLQGLGVFGAINRVHIDERALVITPYQQAANVIREFARGDKAHGTCGLGIGETVADQSELGPMALRVGDLRDENLLKKKLAYIHEFKLAQMHEVLRAVYDRPVREGQPGLLHWLSMLSDERGETLEFARATFLRVQTKMIADAELSRELIADAQHVIFEGAQGVLLDQWHGFHPHTTWSYTTTRNAEDLIRDAGREGPVRKIGVTRAYATRHGAGPMPTENAQLTAALPDKHNLDTSIQGQFRVGWFDAPLARYALSVCPVDELAITCLDRLSEWKDGWRLCDSYDLPELSAQAERFILVDGAAVTPIAKEAGDLEYQEHLTKDLVGATPLLESVPSDPFEYVSAIEEKLQVPVTIRSFGPTAADKRFSQ